jgi:hypothetical protein
MESERTKPTRARVVAQGMQSISLAPGTDDPRIEAQPLYVADQSARSNIA